MYIAIDISHPVSQGVAEMDCLLFVCTCLISKEWMLPRSKESGVITIYT